MQLSYVSGAGLIITSMVEVDGLGTGQAIRLAKDRSSAVLWDMVMQMFCLILGQHHLSHPT